MKKIYLVKLIISLVVSLSVGHLITAQTTWYALNSGNWDNPDNWTLDPAAALHVNPTNSFPNAASHNVVIKTGITITVPVKVPALVLNCGTLTHDGRLDFGTTSGHSFSSILGSGRILLKGDNFPSGNATHFITKGQGEGTVVFQGNSFSLTNARTYYNVEVEMTSGQILTLASNITINGNLSLISGTFNVGNNATTRTLVVNEDITVSSGATFGVGNANAIHILDLFGNFLNSGTVQFSNAAQYAVPTTGALKIYFKGASNKQLTANGATNFYRMFVNKGVDQSYILSASSNNQNNFKLFGPVTGISGLEAGDGTLGWEQLPLVLRNGTLRLGANIVIPQLGYNRGNNNPKEFTIPASARLWVDGASVTTATGFGGAQDWTGISVFGTLQISSGTFTTPALSSGITYYNNASQPANLVVTGGTVNATQLWQKDSNGRLNYSQTGGIVNFTSAPANNWSSPVFSMPDASQVFEMSAGEMIFSFGNNHNVTGIYINSADGNHNVTGGTIEVRIPADRDFKICTKAPLFNLKTVSTGSAFKVWMTNMHGSNDTFFDGELNVLNNLDIASGTTFDAGAFNLVLGRNLTVDGTFNPTGKIILNGTLNGVITKNTGTFTINKLFIDKELPNATVQLAGLGNFAITDSLTLIQGNLNLAGFTVPAQGHITLMNGSISASGSGRLRLTGSTARNLHSAKGKDLNFGVLELDKTVTAPQITFTSNAKVKEIIFARDQVVNIGSFNLEVEVANYASGSWSATRMFRSSGLASDGGLTLPVVLNTNYGTGTVVQIFPVGAGTTYNPMTMFARNNLNSSGTVRVIPINSTHPTVDDNKKNDAIPFYWRVSNNLSVASSNLRYHFLFGSNISSPLQKARVLTNFVWSEPAATFPGNNSIDYPFGTNLEQDYTAGNQSAFNSITRFFSKTSGNWNSASTWTTNPDHSTGTGSVPKSYDVVIIGGSGASNHNVTLSENGAVASQLYIKGKSETGIGVGNDAIAPPTITIAHNTSGHSIDLIIGHGRIVHQNNHTFWSNYPVITGDYTGLCNSTEAILEFTGTGAGPRIMPSGSVIATYPNLTIGGTNGTSQFNGGDLKVKGNLTLNSTTFNLPATNNGMVNIDGNVVINTGTLGFSNGFNHHMTINGNLIFTGNGTFNGQSGTSEKNLYLKGNISVGAGNVQFNETQKINLIFNGDNGATYSRSSGTVNFYRVTVDKPVGVEVAFNSSFNLGAPSNGATKALILKSGIAHLNSSLIDINLSTGGADFKIPSTSVLNVNNGAKINIGGTQNTGLWLDGSLIVNNGSEANIDRGTGGGLDNYIQYTASGFSTIWVGNNSKLIVGSQIRRATTTSVGALKFTQANANTTINVGTKSAPVNDRGVFEILNDGSSFVQSEPGSNISILRAQTSPAYPALYFNPATVSISSGSGFTIGGGIAGQNIGIFAGKPLQNLILGSTNSPTAKIWTSAITINGNLTINTGATFDANALDVTLLGNLVNSGSYLANGNTTYFSGTSNQTITGTATFFNLVKNVSTSRLSLSGTTPVTVENNLTLSTGNFDTGINSVVVKGNVLIAEGFYTMSSGASEGFVLQGTSPQRLTGTGTFARLTIDNPNGVIVPTQSSSVKYSEALRLKQGILDIGRNLMIIEKNASIVAANAFSSTNMVQTNLSFTDAGIMKYIPAGAITVVFPIGSGGKYTPVTLNVTNNILDNGYIRVKASDEAHVTVLDKNNVLNYNWTLEASGVSAFTGNAVMQAIPTDAKVSAPNVIDNYIAARILSGSIDWNKLSNIVEGSTLIEGYDKTNHRLVFRFSNTNATLINGDYTAGIENAIPDQVPSYSTVSNGNWSNKMTWGVYNPVNGTTGAAGVNVPEGGPRGSIIHVNNELSITDNFMSSYRSIINTNGVLKVGNTINHRLGNVSGTGRIVLENGSFPAGFYDSFFLTSGGTVEFAGTGDYDVLSEIPMINNLVFSGSGIRRLPNLDNLLIQGSLTIQGSHIVNEFSKTLLVRGNIIFNSGSFTAKTGTIELSGSNNQTISGSASFTGASGLYNLKINNGVGVAFQNHVEVNNILSFDKGIISTIQSAKLTLTNSAVGVITGSSDSKYVSGPLRKNINSGESFTFPIGKGGRYGQLIAGNVSAGGIWEGEYFNTGAPDRSNFDSSVKFVSSSEYWNVISPSAGANAMVTLRWDANSGVNPDDAAFRVVSATASTWSAVNFTDKTGTMAGGSVKTTLLGYNNSRRFTFGSFSVAPYTWEGTTNTDWFTSTNWSGGVVPSASNNATIASSSRNPIISGNFIAQTNDLTINTGAVLTVNPGGKLTVNGNLSITDTGGLALVNQTGDNGMASLITKGSITGSSNMRLTVPKDQWFYLSSASNDARLGNFSTGTVGTSVHVFRSNQWFSTGASHTNTALLKLEGVLVKYSPAAGSTFTINYNGTPGTGPVVRTYTAAGWYLFGNPYPSFINWQNDNGWTRPNVDGTIWYRSKVGEIMTFITYNRLAPAGARVAFYPGGPTANETEMAQIPPMQSVWVKAFTPTSITVDNNIRTHGVTGSRLKSGSTGSTADVIRITSSNSKSMDGSVIYFNQTSTEGVDEGDSEKRLNDSDVIPEVYTRIGTTAFAINGMVALESNNRTVPISVRNRNQENVTLTFDLNLFNAGHVVTLEDRETGEIVNLRANNTYTYTPSRLGEVHDRFALNFNLVTTSVVNPDIAAEENKPVSGIKITGANGRAIVTVKTELLDMGDAHIEVFSLDGQKVSETMASTSQSLIILPKVNSVFVIKVTAGTEMKTEKVKGKS